jgi:polygalacturonase
MDTHYTASVGAERGRIPVFREIALRNVRVSGGGRLTFDGYDQSHRLGMTFDNVTVDPSAALKWIFAQADFTLGPGPVNFRPNGPDVAVQGKPGKGAANACAGKFLPMP